MHHTRTRVNTWIGLDWGFVNVRLNTVNTVNDLIEELHAATVNIERVNMRFIEETNMKLQLT